MIAKQALWNLFNRGEDMTVYKLQVTGMHRAIAAIVRHPHEHMRKRASVLLVKWRETFGQDFVQLEGEA